MFDKSVPVPVKIVKVGSGVSGKKKARRISGGKAKYGMGVRIENGRGRPSIYCFERMEVGDSYLFKNVSGDVRQSGPVRAMYRADKKHGIKLTYKKIGDDVRIWRVE